MEDFLNAAVSAADRLNLPWEVKRLPSSGDRDSPKCDWVFRLKDKDTYGGWVLDFEISQPYPPSKTRPGGESTEEFQERIFRAMDREVRSTRFQRNKTRNKAVAYGRAA